MATDGVRFRALDGLRGIAALLVVLLHAPWTNHLTFNTFVQNGYLAVDIFFILSGLVIASNYVGRIASVSDAKKFMCLRFFRLYPLHIAALAAFVVLECAKLVAQSSLGVAPGAHLPFTKDSSLASLAANILLIQGLPLVGGEGWNGPSWSISCEFAAYVVFALAVLSGIVRRKVFFVIGSLIAGSCYAALALRRGNLNVVDLGIVRCLAGFFFGMLIFRIVGRNAVRQPGIFLRGLEVAVTVAIITTMATTSGPLVVLVIPLAVILIALLHSDRGPVAHLLLAPPIQVLGRLSYSIYMVHEFLVVCLLIVLKRAVGVPLLLQSIRAEPIVAVNPWTGDLLICGLVVVVLVTAAATYGFIEEPGRMFGRRLVAQAGTTLKLGELSSRVDTV